MHLGPGGGHSPELDVESLCKQAEENESVKQRLLPALVASSAWREGGGS